MTDWTVRCFGQWANATKKRPPRRGHYRLSMPVSRMRRGSASHDNVAGAQMSHSSLRSGRSASPCAYATAQLVLRKQSSLRPPAGQLELCEMWGYEKVGEQWPFADSPLYAVTVKKLHS